MKKPPSFHPTLKPVKVLIFGRSIPVCALLLSKCEPHYEFMIHIERILLHIFINLQYHRSLSTIQHPPSLPSAPTTHTHTKKRSRNKRTTKEEKMTGVMLSLTILLPLTSKVCMPHICYQLINSSCYANRPEP